MGCLIELELDFVNFIFALQAFRSVNLIQEDTNLHTRLSWSSPPPSVKWWNFVLYLIKHIAVNRPNWLRWRIWDENKTKQRSHLFAGKYNLQGPEHDSEIKSRIQVHSLSFPWLETNNHEFVFIFIVYHESWVMTPSRHISSFFRVLQSKASAE